MLLVLIIAFDYDYNVYAREAASFSHSYTSQWLYFNSGSATQTPSYNLTFVLTYEDLVEYLGTSSIGDTLTFTITDISNIGWIKATDSSVTPSVNNATPTSSINIIATPAGGGNPATNITQVGEQITISYGGGDITFKTLPVYLNAVVPQYQSVFCYISSTWSFSFAAAPRSDNEALNDLVDNQEQFRQEDREDATKAGEDAGGLVEEMQTLKEKWAILWYPIEFTQQLLQVFTGGSSARSYVNKYYNVSGYSYNEDTGFLEPVRNPIMTLAAAEAEGGGATITFPAYTLPVLDVQLWDSYTFDLTVIKDSFPLLFDSLYVVVSVLEVFWFVSFLKNKFDEVFS